MQKVIHGVVEKVGDKSLTLKDGSEVPFDYLIVASGTRYISSTPFKLQKESKAESIAILEKSAETIKHAKTIVCVGGGPIGMESAAEIKEKYPEKDVTIIHNGPVLLSGYDLRPSFPKHTHDVLVSLGVKVVLNERVHLQDLPPFDASIPHSVRTESGKSFSSDLTLNCIGISVPNTEFLADSFLDEKKKVKVNSFLQVTSNPRIFSLGDVAASNAPPRFTSINDQAEIVATNILASIQGKGLKEYKYKAFNAMFLAFGKNRGVGCLPFWMPQFMTDGMAKSFKSPDLFGAMNAKAAYNLA